MEQASSPEDPQSRSAAGANAPLMSALDTDKNHSLGFNEYLGFVEAIIKNPQPAVAK